MFSDQEVFKKTDATTVTQLLRNRQIWPFATLFPQPVLSKGDTAVEVQILPESLAIVCYYQCNRESKGGTIAKILPLMDSVVDNSYRT